LECISVASNMLPFKILPETKLDDPEEEGSMKW
jgi:hypothetical protein